jgi:ribosomal protein S26
VQCAQCGKMVLRDKAIEKRKSSLPLDHRLKMLLKKKDTYISAGRQLVYYVSHAPKTENTSS